MCSFRNELLKGILGVVKMRIILDGMGGDNAPDAVIEGALQAKSELSGKAEIVLVGQESVLRESIKKLGGDPDAIEIVNADEVITNDESPVRAIRRKKESSIVKGLEMLRQGKGDAFVSAGSTGALLAGGLLILGRVEGVERPSLATIYPVIGQKPSLILDAGANSECRPSNLQEFGIMGSIYMEKVLGRENPTVGLINIGTEEGKGTQLTKEAYKLLKGSNINFIGNVESRELQNSCADVIVTDGFTGNALIKLTEGVGQMVLREMKKRFTANLQAKLGAALLKEQLLGIKKEFNYSEYGGAPILGVRGVVLKSHGSSDAMAIKQTILKSIPFVENGVVDTIETAMMELIDEDSEDAADI